ncbi:MAG: diaminopimelate decarboxylase [Acidimicrobiales bacterium]
MTPLPRHLLPDTAVVDDGGRLSIGGCDVLDLAAQHGTPLFVYDEAHLRARCREAMAAFPDGVAYATKAFLCRAMARLVHEEGLYLDVASGGELHVVLAAGVPAERLVVHGNNKSEAELARALDVGAGRIVVDSDDELDRLERVVAGGVPPPSVLIRITPGVEAHTHELIRTGQLDSKFGFAVATGAAEKALARAAASPAVELVGIHVHIGSQVFVADFFHQAIDVLAPFVTRFELPELSIGGGLGVAYIEEDDAPTITEWGASVLDACRAAGVHGRVTAEPGRVIAAAAAITVYEVGTIKELHDIRTYVAVDGGFGDNPRPVLYGSGYESFLPRATFADRTRTVTVVGKHCESGDLLVRDARVPEELRVGDYLATPVTGAYGHSMGSNYNKVHRPAVLFVRDGEARLVVRREDDNDLLATDLD